MLASRTIRRIRATPNSNPGSTLRFSRNYPRVLSEGPGSLEAEGA